MIPSKDGWYDFGDNTKYDIEACYYLDFQIKSALFSLEQMSLTTVPQNSLNGNKYQHYHFYTDHLLFSLGQIANRFVNGFEKKDSIVRKRKEANRSTFSFDENKFPILCNKAFRNTIEHIDEYDQEKIYQFNGVGGFNVIFQDSSTEIITALRSRRNVHIYTLDLSTNKLLITRDDVEMDLNLDELKAELKHLQENVTKIYDRIKRG